MSRQGRLRLHLVAVELLSSNGELFRHYIAHVHQVLQPLLQNVVNIYVV